MILSPYRTEIPLLSEVATNKHVLFDSDAIITLIGYQALSLLEELERYNVVFCNIDPVTIELLMARLKPKDRALRLSILARLWPLPLTNSIIALSKDIRLWMSNHSCFPSPTDLYLGSTLACFRSSMLLLTANLSDFPHPLFERTATIICQTRTNCKNLTLLSFNYDILEKFIKEATIPEVRRET